MISNFKNNFFFLKLTFLKNSDYFFKLLLIGDSGVGKSCLILRFAVRKNLKTPLKNLKF